MLECCQGSYWAVAEECGTCLSAVRGCLHLWPRAVTKAIHILWSVFFLAFWSRQSVGNTNFLWTDFLAIQKNSGRIICKQLVQGMHKFKKIQEPPLLGQKRILQSTDLNRTSLVKARIKCLTSGIALECLPYVATRVADTDGNLAPDELMVPNFWQLTLV
jgi:hypothetical protein